MAVVAVACNGCRKCGMIALLKCSSLLWMELWILSAGIRLASSSMSMYHVSVCAYLPHVFGYRRWVSVCIWHQLTEPRHLKTRESISSCVMNARNVFEGDEKLI